jgi:hypothetical protein
MAACGGPFGPHPWPFAGLVGLLPCRVSPEEAKLKPRGREREQGQRQRERREQTSNIFPAFSRLCTVPAGMATRPTHNGSSPPFPSLPFPSFSLSNACLLFNAERRERFASAKAGLAVSEVVRVTAGGPTVRLGPNASGHQQNFFVASLGWRFASRRIRLLLHAGHPAAV